MQGHGRGRGEGLVPWRVKPRGEKRNQTPAYVNAEQQEGGARGVTGKLGGEGMAGTSGTSDTLAQPRRSGKRGDRHGGRGFPAWLGRRLRLAGQAPLRACREQASLAGRPGPAPPGAAAPALAMPVMSALPARKVKGAGANHSPSVLPAGIRQRRGSRAALPAK